MMMIKNENIETQAKFTYSYEENVIAVIIGSTETSNIMIFFLYLKYISNC